jgi:chemotaxis protein histidine kinase CheA
MSGFIEGVTGQTLRQQIPLVAASADFRVFELGSLPLVKDDFSKMNAVRGQLGIDAMFETRKDVERLAADLQDAIRQTRRMGFTATAEAMAELLRDLERVSAPKEQPAEELARQ